MTSAGYIRLSRPDHPRADPNGYVYEHDLVMEAKLGRFLEPGELVHHEDENKGNNDPGNLVLHTRTTHGRLHNAARNRDARGRFVGGGGLTPKQGGRLLDGRTWDEFPATKVMA